MRPRIKSVLALKCLISLALLSPAWSQNVYDDALDAWVAAATSGDPQIVEQFLAPEFQILRGNGRRYDAPNYLADGLPSISRVLKELTHIEVTKSEDVMVVSYWLTFEVDEGNQKSRWRAPRLTVFRKIDGDWRVSAHANFAVPID